MQIKAFYDFHGASPGTMNGICDFYSCPLLKDPFMLNKAYFEEGRRADISLRQNFTRKFNFVALPVSIIRQIWFEHFKYFEGLQ